MNEVTKKKDAVVGVASLNLAEFASAADGKELEIIVPLSPRSVASESQITLEVCLLSSKLPLFLAIINLFYASQILIKTI